MLELLFPTETALRVQKSNLTKSELEIVAYRLTNGAKCPKCNSWSGRRHSTYQRSPSDLPCLGYQVSLSLAVTRFFCDNDTCTKKTFAEEFPGLLRRWARRTERLKNQQLVVGFELGGEAGHRVLQALKMPISADTIIDDIRGAPEPETKEVRVLGIDDWAKRKGVEYGTILVDLESGEPIDVLDGRDVKTVKAWLANHPEIEIVSRDRSKEYKKAVSEALPEATQVADRWHLLQNLREATEKFICNKPASLQAAAQGAATASVEATDTEDPSVLDNNDHPNELVDSAEKESMERPTTLPVPKIVEEPPKKTQTKAEQQSAARRARRQERFDLVKQLHQSGRSIRSIAIEMKMSVRTVRKYVQADECPQYPTGVRRTAGKLTPFLSYLESRWQEGTTNGTQLWRELRDERGFTGSRGLVARWAAVQRKLLPRPLQYARKQPEDIKPPIVRLAKPAPWSARAVSWLLFHEKERLDAEERAALDAILANDEEVATAYEFIQQFRRMVKQRLSDSLEDWLDKLQKLKFRGLLSFANGLRQDFEETRNALSMIWSNAACEGHVNRLKFLKRQMYGRASFDLLRKRVLYRPSLG